MFEFENFKNLRVVQYEAIPIVKDMECPQCHRSDVNGTLPCVYAEPIGWCETPTGFMAVFECPKCFTKFRCHINASGRYREEAFKEDLWLIFHLYPKRKEKRV